MIGVAVSPSNLVWQSPEKLNAFFGEREKHVTVSTPYAGA
jgi:hypothetical protein